MLAGVRHHKIKEMVDERGTIRVTELSQMLGVTDETIRRDLERLEGQGKLLRTHGGAISIKQEEDDVPHFQREVINKEEKISVAKEAIKLIEDGDIIFLDASSSALYLARLIPDMHLTVLTNSIQICVALAGHTQIQVICTGGTLSARSMSYVGQVALNTLDSYYVDKLFFSCKGLDEEWGISDGNELQALVKQKVIDRATKRILLLDHSKLGKKAFARISSSSSIDTIIVDSKAEQVQLEFLREQGTKIVLPELIKEAY
ncbi:MULTISPECIES: DeoR/GlpR family DNA-binding transcription regulator [unclassified Sporosarcina]|uniref:DeoR/GlpR family DNA-binding transcription regulator n=1 Tax=unclassified Sporosarcina TaxID=2647733 RepID=UPI00203D1F75|nr:MULTISPECIES: DeoR/GlpR family DNA-binding transcription regulator [unclassified Sporosarcina]GKV65937.1 putative HTH-type transcriptional regulator YulB [Sporosarcina sp. NCCP-2331]GLB56063.1 putative HTH-type transcriptional regulator YulB [Sporosarcina sp. NCCP-2378]